MTNKRHIRIGPHVAPEGQFTGKSKSNSKKKNKSTRKQRKLKHKTHVSKY